MAGLATHVLDTSDGPLAEGLVIDLWSVSLLTEVHTLERGAELQSLARLEADGEFAVHAVFSAKRLVRTAEEATNPRNGCLPDGSLVARFKSRLRAAGISDDQFQKLICPIGIDGVESKEPSAIAIPVAGQLKACKDGSLLVRESGRSQQRDGNDQLI
ncbi:MAG: hypothetical protein CMO26_10050 [Thiotrichales bacterium]|nr:hypothetical protein [Thiotrichales bacterium]